MIFRRVLKTVYKQTIVYRLNTLVHLASVPILSPISTKDTSHTAGPERGQGFAVCYEWQVTNLIELTVKAFFYSRYEYWLVLYVRELLLSSIYSLGPKTDASCSHSVPTHAYVWTVRH